MGKIISETRKITLNESTKFVIDCYHQALLDAGLIEKATNEKNSSGEADYTAKANFHPYLLIDVQHSQKKPGFKNFAKEIGEKISNNLYGASYCIMKKVTFDLDNDLYESYAKNYLPNWQNTIQNISIGLLSGHISSTDMNQVKVNNPHVLTMHLIQRLLAFTLDNKNLTNYETHFKALYNFIENVTNLANDNMPFRAETNSYDKLGIYLLSAHKQSLANFHDSIRQKGLLSQNINTINDVENFLIEIEKIILCQLIAYWNPTAKGADVQPLSYYNSLQTIEETLWKKCSSESGSETLDKRSAILRYSEQIKPHPHIKIIKSLYNLAMQIGDLIALVKSIKSFLQVTGWLGSLAGGFKLSPLGNYLEKFAANATAPLDILSNGLDPNSEVVSALLNQKAGSRFGVNLNIRYIQESLNKVDDYTFQKEVKDKINEDVKLILQLQKKLGMNQDPILDIEKLSDLLGEDVQTEQNNDNKNLSEDQPRKSLHNQATQTIDDDDPPPAWGFFCLPLSSIFRHKKKPSEAEKTLIIDQVAQQRVK